MALQEVACEGYRAFGALTRLGLRRLTVIFGRNNSGKTTLARLPIFAAASLTDYEHLYVLSWGDVRFGSSFADLASMDQVHPKIFFRLRWEPSRSLGIELQHVTTSVEQQSVQPRMLTVDGMEPIGFELRKLPVAPAFSFVQKTLKERELEIFDSRRRELSEFVREIIHIPGGRLRVESTYAMREPTSWTVDEVPYLLATRRGLMDEVASWFYHSLHGTRVNLDQAAFAFRLVEERDGFFVSLAESGRGIQSVLPVVTLLLGIATEERRAQFIVVEEPEEHLHPSAHGAVADLLIECSAKAQTIVETHSENLILRLRRRIAEGLLPVDDLGLYFVDESHNVVPISLDSDGSATNWPSGVFESDVEEAQAIVEAKLAALGGRG